MGFRFAMENVIDQRADGRLPPEAIVDVHLRDIIRDPGACLETIYGHFGLQLGDDAVANFTGYLQNKPKGKFGQHEYDMATFGMTAQGLRERFKRYTDYYNVELEA